MPSKARGASAGTPSGTSFAASASANGPSGSSPGRRQGARSARGARSQHSACSRWVRKSMSFRFASMKYARSGRRSGSRALREAAVWGRARNVRRRGRAGRPAFASARVRLCGSGGDGGRTRDATAAARPAGIRRVLVVQVVDPAAAAAGVRGNERHAMILRPRHPFGDGTELRGIALVDEQHVHRARERPRSAARRQRARAALAIRR